MDKDKGKLLNEKIEEKLKLFPYDKHNALEKILFTEYLIRDELIKELAEELNEKQLNILKGVVITESKDEKGKRRGIGDCDLIIYQKGEEDACYAELVVVKKEFVKGIISVSSKLNYLKDKRLFDALLKQHKVCENVVALCRKGKFSGERKDKKLKEGESELINKILGLIGNGIKVFVLERKFDGPDKLKENVGNFDELIEYIRKKLGAVPQRS